MAKPLTDRLKAGDVLKRLELRGGGYRDLARHLRAANYYSEASDKADATPDTTLFTSTPVASGMPK